MPLEGTVCGFIDTTDAATTAWVTAVNGNGGSVTGPRQILVDNLIVGLKADGVWSKLDRLWIFAAENSPSALTDLVGGNLATAVNSPTFTTDRGYDGQDLDIPTKYIDSGFTPSSGITYTQNSAHYSAWSVTNIASTGGTTSGVWMGAADATYTSHLYNTYPDGNIYARINTNSASGSQGAPGTRAGHWALNRSGGSATQLYQNGANFSSPNETDNGVPTVVFYILCHNLNSAAKFGTPNRLAMASMGGSLSSTDANNFYNRLRTYMTAVGVP